MEDKVLNIIKTIFCLIMIFVLLISIPTLVFIFLYNFVSSIFVLKYLLILLYIEVVCMCGVISVRVIKKFNKENGGR